jgi:cytidylate kinase
MQGDEFTCCSCRLSFSRSGHLQGDVLLCDKCAGYIKAHKQDIAITLIRELHRRYGRVSTIRMVEVEETIKQTMRDFEEKRG